MSGTAYLLTLSCPNQPGIVARVTAELFAHDGDIIEAQQFDDAETGRFFMRIMFDLPASGDIDALKRGFAPIARRLRAWTGRSAPRDERRKVLILASKFDHCLVDLLYRWRIGELPMDVVGIVSNHPREAFAPRDLRRHPVPPSAGHRGRPSRSRKRRSRRSSSETGAELVVLARYMQILSDDLARDLSGRCINIHHSFLPGFKGAKPYHQAHRPRREADRRDRALRHRRSRRRADHRAGRRADQPSATAPRISIRKGRDIERRVLARAVAFHLDGRVLINDHKTVVFRD